MISVIQNHCFEIQWNFQHRTSIIQMFHLSSLLLLIYYLLCPFYNFISYYFNIKVHSIVQIVLYALISRLITMILSEEKHVRKKHGTVAKICNV